MHSAAEKERYSRQLTIFGEEGQEKLSSSRILIAGAGGLGTAAALGAAAAGVGTLRIADFDRVERHNLNRQVLFSEEVIGRPKTGAIAAALHRFNPHIRIEGEEERIDAETAPALIRDCDVVIDALDNYETRYILSDAAWEAEVPFIHGGISGFYGQVSTIIPDRGPCLRCIVPHPPPEENVPILGVTSLVTGSIQATEALKVLLGRGDLIESRILLWDGLSGTMDTLHLESRDGCPLCGGRQE